MSVIAVHLVIKGKVQGVFYRKTARQKALDLDLKGWVRNLDTGEVEIEAEGNEKVIGEFIDWCAQGPEKAIVTEIMKENTLVKGFSDFSIK